MSWGKTYPLLFIAIVVLAAAIILQQLEMYTSVQWLTIIFVTGVVIYTSIDMVKDILRGHWGLDILAVVAMASTVIVGEYFASLIIVLMISGGEALEDFAARRAKRDLSALLDRSPAHAHLVSYAAVEARSLRLSGATDLGQWSESEQIIDVHVGDVNVGDVLLVRPAELVPVDGVLISGDAELDQSSLTGESLPVQIQTGEDIMSGSVNGSGAFYFQATQTSANSQYQQIVSLVSEVEDSKAPTVRLADRYAIPFTAFSILLGAVAWMISGDPVRFAEVLVLATPCPLLIAAPVAFMGGMSRATKEGIIMKGGAALEALAKVKSVAFDKTGTLTQGEPELVEVRPAKGFDANTLLRFAASAEQYSVHVLAASVVNAARDQRLSLLSVSDVQEIATQGVSGTISGEETRVGKLSFIQEVTTNTESTPLEVGQMAIYVSIGDTFAGAIVMADQVRFDAQETVRELRQQGIEDVIMLTGDSIHVAEAVAAQVGIKTVHADLLPADKVRLAAQLTPAPVLMVGDGINDAPVLAAASVGIAMGARGSTVASESADIVLLTDRIGKVSEAHHIAKQTVNVALTAIWIGIALSVGLMLIAAFGFIPAIYGAFAQEVIDLATILYALRALTAGKKHKPRL